MISPTGNEVGPFLAVEQAALSQATPDARRTPTFAWYNLAGYVATAIGALAAGLLQPGAPRRRGFGAVDAYRAIVVGYAVDRARDGGRLLRGSGRRSRRRRAGRRRRDPPPARARHRSRGIVARLSALFALDAFAGGFVPQSLMAYWFHLQFGVEPAVLGGIFFGANLLAAVSSLSAARIAGPDRADQHDGLHPPAVERAADPRAADAEPAARDRRPARSASASARWTCRPASRT